MIAKVFFCDIIFLVKLSKEELKGMATDKTSKNGSNSKKKSQKKTRSFKKFLKISFVSSIIFLFAITGILAGTIIGFIQTSDAVSPEDLALTGFTTNIFDYEGNLMTPLHGDKNREWVDINTVPDNLKNAFIAIEDKRFYQHPGIDIKRTLSAGIGFLQSSNTTHGGSTITQQVVRNLTNEFERTIQRKLQEQWRAIELERHLTKDQILEIYVNVIYMGNNAYGVQSASKLYFNKDVADLTLGESAVIASITNRPSYFNPLTEAGRENVKIRQEIILSEMLGLYITEEEYQSALNEELQYAIKNNDSNANATVQSYFVDQVVTDVRKDLMAKGYSYDLASKMIYNNGLKIYTTMDKNLQRHIEAVFSNPTNFPVVQQNLAPKASMVILDVKTGQVRALYGGAGPKEISMGFNFATDLKKQPGSTMKPIAVYGPAIDLKKLTAGTVFDDVAIYMDPQNPDERYPTNYNKTQYRGLVTAREALKVSLNTVAAKVWAIDSGFSRSALQYLKKVDINRDQENYISTALGGLEDGVSPLQMAAAYVPFANKGVYAKPTTYTKVEDSRGNILLENKPAPVFVYDDTTAFIITDMLKDAVSPGGTGYPYGLIQNGAMPSAGKTGTTSENFDKWFVGYSPYYVGATWYGYERNTTLTPNEYNKALSLWSDVMERVHKNLPSKPFDTPSGIVKKMIDKYSGKVPSPLSYQDPRGDAVLEEIYARGTEPNDMNLSDIHVKATICIESTDELGRNLLWDPSCPEHTAEERIFIKRKPSYIRTKTTDPYPLDWQYELPTEYCQSHEAPIEIENEEQEEDLPESPSPPVRDRAPTLVEELFSDYNKEGQDE
jgi:penicillin-binding protein 1A